MQVIDLDQPGRGGVLKHLHTDWLPRELCRPGQDLGQLVGVVDRGDEHRVPVQGRQIGDPGGEGALQPGRQRQSIQLPAGHRAQRCRELDEGERVAEGRTQDPLPARGAEIGGLARPAGPRVRGPGSGGR